MLPGGSRKRLVSVVSLLVIPAALLMAGLGRAWVVDAQGTTPKSTLVSHLRDSRIKESSGLAVSRSHPGLVYTMNDSGYRPLIYTVNVSTGETVGVTDIRGGTIEDTESISLDAHGTLWLADLGDNDEKRTNVALYSLPEPGPGTHHVKAKRYAVSYPDGPVNVETLLLDPHSGAKFIATKVKEKPGEFYALPKRLSTTSRNLAKDLGRPSPVKATDGAFTNDGTEALVRTNDEVYFYDPATWSLKRSLVMPKVEQGESISMESSDTSYLIGSEGPNSPLIRVAYSKMGTGPASSSPKSSHDALATSESNDSRSALLTGAAAGGLAVVLLGGGAVLLKRRTSRR
jgi:hypothetical protein